MTSLSAGSAHEEADVLSWFTKRVTKKDPLWIRLLGFAAGGALATIGTIIIRYTAGIGDDAYRQMRTIGLMFVAIGLVGSVIACASRSSDDE